MSSVSARRARNSSPAKMWKALSPNTPRATERHRTPGSPPCGQRELAPGPAGEPEALGQVTKLVEVVQVVLGAGRAGEVPPEAIGGSLDEPLAEVAGLGEWDAVGELVEQPSHQRQRVAGRQLDRVEEPVGDRREKLAAGLAPTAREPGFDSLGEDGLRERLAGQLPAGSVQMGPHELLLAAPPALGPRHEIAAGHRQLQEVGRRGERT